MDWLEYEKKYYDSEDNIICGVDEAGRGPLAGPVYAAAVVLPRNFIIEGVNDSKKLSAKKREELYKKICEQSLGYAIGISSAQEIDEINILKATHLAMTRAVNNLKQKINNINIILIDGNSVPEIKNSHVECIIKGDSLSHSIACASILAKVSRDRYMIEQSEIYSDYKFENHKGYGTKLHIDMIKKHGPCEIHRKSFLTKIYE